MTESDVKQIKKGILKILILKLLQQEKKYGYELLVEMSQKSKGFFKVKEGTLYPILYKLEEDGLVISEWEIPHDKMRVKKILFYNAERKRWTQRTNSVLEFTFYKSTRFLLEDNEYEEWIKTLH